MTPLETKRPLQLNDQGQLRHFLEADARPQLDPVRRQRWNHDSNL